MKHIGQLLKINKWKKYMGLIVLVCFVSTFALGCAAQKNSKSVIVPLENKQNSDSDAKVLDEYISKNYSSIDLNNGDLGNHFRILDKDLDKYEVFLTGEFHSVAANYKLKLAFVKYFNDKAGIKYLLSEMGFSSSAYINRYLETGDEENLNIVFDARKGTAAWSKDEYEFYKKLREYNRLLSDSRKIKVIGIDIEHKLGFALNYIYSVLPKEAEPVEIKDTLSRLKRLKGKPLIIADLEDIIIAIQRDIEENEESYKSYFEDSYLDFSMVVDNIYNCLNAHENRDKFDKIREESIYNNFKKVYKYLPKGKFYGQFGMEHVYQNVCGSYLGEQQRLAMYINDSDSLRNKVLSIACGYRDCYYMEYQDGYNQYKVTPLFKDQEYVAKYAKTNITILKLTGENSPFSRQVYFVEKPLGGVTTDYFQYFILIKKSNGTIPMER